MHRILEFLCMPLSVRQVINSFVFRPLKMRDERRNGDTYRNFNTARRKKGSFLPRYANNSVLWGHEWFAKWDNIQGLKNFKSLLCFWIVTQLIELFRPNLLSVSAHYHTCQWQHVDEISNDSPEDVRFSGTQLIAYQTLLAIFENVPEANPEFPEGWR